MRSIFLHLNDDGQEVRKFLDSVCDRTNGNTGEDWVCLYKGDPILYVGIYKDIDKEFEPEELEELIITLGSEPEISVSVDVSGRYSGRAEVIELIKKILYKFDGIVSDNDDSLWTLDEILMSPQEGEKVFFDY